MARHRASIDWSLGEGEDFLAGRYGRGHAVAFEHGPQIRGTASAQVVGNRWSEAGAADPEQLLVAALSACHMLTFLHKAREAGFAVARYHDQAEGLLAKDDGGGLAVVEVVLRPAIAYLGPSPTAHEAERLHHLAHEECFIARSVRTAVRLEPAEG